MLKVIGGLAIFNVIGQFLQFAAQPLLARLYTPADFGVVAQVIFLTSVCSILGTLQIHNYLILEKDSLNRQRMESAGYIIAFSFSLVSSLFFYFFSGFIFGPGVDAKVPFFASIILFLTCVANMFRGSLTADGDFRPMMVYTVVRSFALIITQCVAGWLVFENGLLYGFILGEVFAFFAARPRYFYGVLECVFFPKIRNAFSAFCKELKFFLTGTVQELVAVAVALLPLYFIGRAYGNEVGGFFAMAHKLAWAPVLLASQSISSVLYRHLSSFPLASLAKSRVINPIFTIPIFLVSSAIAFFFMPLVFDLFFEKIWSAAGEMSAWLCLAAFSFLAALPARLVYRILKLQKMQLLIDLLALMVLCSTFFLADEIDAGGVVKLVAITGVIQNIFHILNVQVLVRREEK